MKHRTVRWTRRSALLPLLAARRGARRRNRLRLSTSPPTTFRPAADRSGASSRQHRPGPRLRHDRLAARVRDLREARQLPGCAGRRTDRASCRRSRRRCRRSRRTAHVHVPDPERLRLLPACNGSRDRAEHEVHLRANGAPGHGLARAGPFYDNIVGATEYHGGQRERDHGIVANGNTLTISLIEPQANFLTLLAMPFLCAVPDEPASDVRAVRADSVGRPLLHLSAHDQLSRSSRARNPNYTGPRPRRFDSFEYTIGQPERGDPPAGPVGRLRLRQRPARRPDQELAPLYGPDSPAAGRGLQQWFSTRGSCVCYLPLNTERPLFADANMRKAVNFALDRIGTATWRARTRTTPTRPVPARRACPATGHRRLPRPPRPRAGARSSPTGSRETHCDPVVLYYGQRAHQTRRSTAHPDAAARRSGST